MTEQLAALADFVLHRTVAIHLRDCRKPCSLVLSRFFLEGFRRWKTLAAISINTYLSRLYLHFNVNYFYANWAHHVEESAGVVILIMNKR